MDDICYDFDRRRNCVRKDKAEYHKYGDDDQAHMIKLMEIAFCRISSMGLKMVSRSTTIQRIQ